MSNNDRVAMFPSRANLVLMKQRILAATRGLNLLKRKRDALEMKLRELKAELRKRKDILYVVMQEAYFSMARANYLGTDFKPASVMNTDRADAYMRIKSQKVAGLQLPTFTLVMRQPTCFPFTGLSRGGQQVEDVRLKFQEALRVLIALASLEYSVRVLEEGVRQNNMRLNGLDYVVIPRFSNTAKYIRDELEEYDREEFYRLKRSQAKQRKAKAKFSMMLKIKNMTPEEIEALEKDGVEIPTAFDEKFSLTEFEEKLRQSSVHSKIASILKEPILPDQSQKNHIETQTSEIWDNLYPVLSMLRDSGPEKALNGLADKPMMESKLCSVESQTSESSFYTPATSQKLLMPCAETCYEADECICDSDDSDCS